MNILKATKKIFLSIKLLFSFITKCYFRLKFNNQYIIELYYIIELFYMINNTAISGNLYVFIFNNNLLIIYILIVSIKSSQLIILLSN